MFPPETTTVPLPVMSHSRLKLLAAFSLLPPVSESVCPLRRIVPQGVEALSAKRSAPIAVSQPMDRCAFCASSMRRVLKSADGALSSSVAESCTLMFQRFAESAPAAVNANVPAPPTSIVAFGLLLFALQARANSTRVPAGTVIVPDDIVLIWLVLDDFGTIFNVPWSAANVMPPRCISVALSTTIFVFAVAAEKSSKLHCVVPALPVDGTPFSSQLFWSLHE